MMLAGIVGNVGSARLRLNGGEFYEVKGELRLSEWIDKGCHLTEKRDIIFSIPEMKHLNVMQMPGLKMTSPNKAPLA